MSDNNAVNEAAWLKAAGNPEQLERLTKAATQPIVAQPMPRSFKGRSRSLDGRRMIDIILRAVAPTLRDLIKRVAALEAEPRMRTVGHYVGGWCKEYNYSIGHTVNHSGSLWYCEVAGTTDRPGDDGPGWSAAVKRAPEGNFVPRRATFTGGELETESKSLETRIAELESETASAMKYRDVFQQGETYEKNEVVTHASCTWIARRRTNAVPSTSGDWKMTAKPHVPRSLREQDKK